MLVYVLNKEGKPLMPCNAVKARILLKQGKAKVIRRTPFTIQLVHGSSGYKQGIILGVDTGSKMIGLSAVTDKKEVFSSEVILRKDVVELLSIRRQNRNTRRSRLRHRQPRFLNRISTKKKGWLAPSIRNKIDTHLKVVNKIHDILPISKIIVEVASFDIQKIKNPEINGIEYQQGDQLGFWNVRQFVLYRDGHQCQGRKGCKCKILNVHHKVSRQIGGNSPDNLTTLCEECHQLYHKGLLKLNFKRGKSFRDATFMGIMRWSFYNKLKEKYANVDLTYGYITKNTRISNQLSKTHAIDALCITGKPNIQKQSSYFLIKQVRKNNRQTHRSKLLKGGKKKLRQSPYLVYNFRLFDKVMFENQECFIFGRRKRGYFDLRLLDGTKIHTGATSVKNLNLLEKRKTLLFERRWVS